MRDFDSIGTKFSAKKSENSSNKDYYGIKIESKNFIIGKDIYFYGTVNRDNILLLNSTLEKLRVEGMKETIGGTVEPEPIIIHVNSWGGYLDDGFAALDCIERVKKCIPVHTIVEGTAASAATFISMAGNKRMIGKYSTMLIHQLSSGIWGKYEEIKDEMINLDKFMKSITDFYAKATSLKRNEIKTMLKKDIFFTSSECLEMGFVDEIS